METAQEMWNVTTKENQDKEKDEAWSMLWGQTVGVDVQMQAGSRPQIKHSRCVPTALQTANSAGAAKRNLPLGCVGRVAGIASADMMGIQDEQCKLEPGAWCNHWSPEKNFSWQISLYAFLYSLV